MLPSDLDRWPKNFAQILILSSDPTIYFFCRIACISCPTVFSKLVSTQSPDHHIVLFEYDKHFRSYGEKFIYYDYGHPLSFPDSIKEGEFDLVLADPPFLSEECLAKMTQTVKFLTREKVILCTGNCHMGIRDYGLEGLPYSELLEDVCGNSVCSVCGCIKRLNIHCTICSETWKNVQFAVSPIPKGGLPPY